MTVTTLMCRLRAAWRIFRYGPPAKPTAAAFAFRRILRSDLGRVYVDGVPMPSKPLAELAKGRHRRIAKRRAWLRGEVA